MKFGQKVIEVATFRKQVPASEEITPEPKTAAEIAAEEAAASVVTAESIADLPGRCGGRRRSHRGRSASSLIERDNTFGTPEEDAFRRDFTVNALFYDIANFSVIDYVGGLEDLQARVVRCIGDPDVRLREDPVRMMRAIALAARLDFTIDPPLRESISRLSGEIAASSAPRILEVDCNAAAGRRRGADLPRSRGHGAARTDCSRTRRWRE